MFGADEQEAFVNAPAAAEGTRGERGATALLLLILAGLAGFLLWASVFEIEEVTRGEGRVVPSRQLQVVQTLDPGILRDLAVAEGDLVEAGQVLMTVDDTAADSERGELLQQEAALMAEEVRLMAEIALERAPEFPDALRARAEDAVLAEIDVLEARFQQLDNEVEVLEDKLAQKRAALAELRARRAGLETVIEPLREEAALTEELARSGAVPRIELLRLRSSLAELAADLAVADAQEPTLLAAISEAESEIAVARSGYILTARQRLAKLRVELAVIREALREAEDRVTRTRLRAPIRGVVNRVNVTTLGGVVEPGAPLVEIVPVDEPLLIEADIRPQDVAFIRPGDPASVKITAYDYLVYGALAGEVLRVGADTQAGAGDTQVFRVTIRTGETEFRAPGGEALPVTPGMTASVDIQTGRRTVLSYLLKPVMRLRSEALRER